MLVADVQGSQDMCKAIISCSIQAAGVLCTPRLHRRYAAEQAKLLLSKIFSKDC